MSMLIHPNLFAASGAPTSPLVSATGSSGYAASQTVDSSTGAARSAVSAPNPSVAGVLVPNRTQIHAQGQFYALGPEDYIGDYPAIKSLLNEKNDLQRKLGEAIDPAYVRIATFIGAVVNLFAVVIVGIGINLVTADKPPNWAMPILIIGIILSAFSTIAPAVVAFFPRLFKK